MEKKEIMDVYMQGFTDELLEEEEKDFSDSILNRAYALGRIDAIIGDDSSSYDNQTEEEIVNRILSKNSANKN